MKVKCNCKHEGQDKLHGKDIRIATPINSSKTLGQLKKVRCTVCGSIHDKWTD